MIVVIPFCEKDWLEAHKNLEWIAKLQGGPVGFEFLLHYDSETTQEHLAIVEVAARACSKKVTRFQYQAPFDKSWPFAPNWAWQACARMMVGRPDDQPWLWLEADANPLLPDWLERLSLEYQKHGQPFMGNVVDGMGHMNGVAIYPKDVNRYCSRVMLCRSSAFDVVLKEDTIAITHKANHLIEHYPRFNGIKLSFTDRKALNKLKKNGVVLFHGCNDGTLLELLNGRKPKPNGHIASRHFTMKDIGQPYDESEACWQQECVRLKAYGLDIAPLDECKRDYVSFTKQRHNWRSGFFNLPLSYVQCHFNPGICEDDSGSTWMVVRRWDRSALKWHSTLVACLLDKHLNVIRQQDLTMPYSDRVENEDPRVTFKDGKFYVCHCEWVHGQPYSANQVLTTFSNTWAYESRLHLNYGRNDRNIKMGSEKNWQWFWHGDRWHIIYSFSPHTILSLIGENKVEEHKSEAPSLWKHGEIRGGTPPVLIDGEYWSFFHSSLPWRGRQKRYYMGAYAFAPESPFRITRITEQPILRGSDDDSRILGGPLVVFPCGAIWRDNGWVVTMGINDEKCGWIHVPHNELVEMTTKC